MPFRTNFHGSGYDVVLNGGIIMHTTLARLPAGISATVVSISCDKALERRLRDFGLIPETEVKVCYRSPHGGVTALECRSAVIALRTNDLRGIRVRFE